MFDKLVVIDPFDDEDRRFLNELFEKGWSVDMRLVKPTEDGYLLAYHLDRCPTCAMENDDLPTDEDADEYEREKQRRLKKLDDLYPRPKDEENE